MKKPVQEGEYCYEVGLLRNGVLLKLGSPEQLKGLTASGLETLVVESMKMDKRFGVGYAKDVTANAFGNYKRTFNRILEGKTEVKKDDGKQQG